MGYSKQIPPQIHWGQESEQKLIKCYIDYRLKVGEAVLQSFIRRL